MSDYTPTLDEIRGQYGGIAMSASGCADDLAEFDRAIEKVRTEAKAEALREAAAEFRNCPDWPYRATRPTATEDYLIARADKLVTE